MSGDSQGAKPGVLYVVATPIGHLGDLTLRAIEILRTVDLIAAEDTRTTRKLLSRYQIKGSKLLAYHEHNEKQRAEEILACLREGASVALVSEAGTPGLSDPGAYLVAQAHKEGLPVRPIPGPSAAIAALSCAGFDLKEGFFFVGFLPAKEGERRRRLEMLRQTTALLVFYEAPHRLRKMLKDALEILGDREVFLAREMTKIHEEYQRSTLKALLEHFQKEAPRGEFTLVVAGAPGKEAPGEEEIYHRLQERLSQGYTVREAARLVAEELELPRSKIYPLALKLKEEAGV